MIPIADLSALELVAALRARQISSVEVTQSSLQRIEVHNPKLCAFLTVCAEPALAQAAEADRQLAGGESDRPLLGVPIAVKDLHETAGVRTTHGLVACAEHIPEADCIVVQRLRDAGAIVVGKTNTPALGLLGESKNRLGPDSVNPWSTDRTSGGSSGGSAAAVAAGLVPWATGSDSAGSITQPAAFCGVYGTKPTHGRIPSWPSANDSRLFADQGPLSVTVADAALMLAVMAGHDARDPVAIRAEPPDFQSAARLGARDAQDSARPLAGLRIGWSHDLGHFPVDGEIRSLAEKAARGMEGMGAIVEEVTPDIEHPFHVYMPIYISNFRFSLGDRLDELRGELFPESLRELEEFSLTSAESYVGCMTRLLRFRAALDDVFARYDLMIMPSTATAPFPCGRPPGRIGGQEVAPGWMTFMPFQIAWNMTGQPTASLPCGVTAEGLPVGVLAAGRIGREDTLLRVSAAFEVRQPWAQNLPRVQ